MQQMGAELRDLFEAYGHAESPYWNTEAAESEKCRDDAKHYKLWKSRTWYGANEYD